MACLPILLSAATPMIAQQASPPQAIPTFKSRTELVTVPVVVLKRQSSLRQLAIQGTLDEHVPGLSKEEFEIEEDGKPQPIASFEEIGSSDARVSPAAPPGNVITNELASDRPVTMIVILLDLINTPYIYQDGAKKKLLDYLQNDFHADRPTMLAVLHPNGLRILHDFTNDPQVLAKIARQLKGSLTHDPTLDNSAESGHAIDAQIDLKQEYDKIEKEFIGSPIGSDAYEQQLKADHLEATFIQLQQLASALSVVRGMKALVWATGGFTLPNSMESRDHRIVEEYVQTLKLLSAAALAVYPIDTVLEIDNPGFSSPQSRLPRSLTRRMSVVQNFMDISQKTGGDYCLLRKDPDLCFRKAVDYNSHYYLLTYYTHSAEKTSWRKIHVKVHNPDLQLRARSGFFSAGANGDPEQRRKRDIAQAFVTPIEYRGLPISVRWTDPKEDPSPKTVGAAPLSDLKLLQRPPKQKFLLGIGAEALTVDTGDRNHIKLDIVVVALDLKGKVLADLTQQIDLHPIAPELQRLRTNGFAYSNEVAVPPRTSKVRFIVRDDLSERIGTVSVPIEAQQ